jgi:hypothetical protein
MVTLLTLIIPMQIPEIESSCRARAAAGECPRWPG